MKGRIWKICLGLCGAALLCADVSRAAETPLRTAPNETQNLAREFSVVPAGDILYTQLATVQKAGWSTLPVEASTSLTRYEMALEVAKALISVRARHNADARWAGKAAPDALRALRELCAALRSELTRFDVNATATIAQIDSWLQNPSPAGDAPRLELSPRAANPTADNRVLGFSRELPIDGQSAALSVSLSQRLRIYAAVSALARAENDPFNRESRQAARSANQRSSNQRNFQNRQAGAALEVNRWLRLRGEATERATSPRLADTLFTGTSTQFTGSERTLGGGVDIALRPGVVLSGDVANIQTSGESFFGISESAFTGTKFQSGLELSGWENRVALSAHLSRLVPEDSSELSRTAAQLNLGLGLTEQVSLRLLYQQLFDAPQQTRGGRVVAGGININF